ncbi:hypothetical protein V8E53_002628 [Lactarius tabidus]
MAQHIHSAKSGSFWTTHDLRAYNIVIEYQDAATFFGLGRENLPQPTINPAFLEATPSENTPDNIEGLFHAMHLATSPPREESAVDDFASTLLRSMGYVSRGRVIRERKDLHLLVCGDIKRAQTDVCIMDQNQMLLLVQEDKRYLDDTNPEPQLIAEAIAAFNENNRIRQDILHMVPLDFKIMPGIIMKGTSPVFYKIEVTKALAANVGAGTYPGRRAVTTVHVHAPNIPRPGLKACVH